MDDTVDVVTDNTDEWKAAFERAIARGLEEVGLAADGTPRQSARWTRAGSAAASPTRSWTGRTRR